MPAAPYRKPSVFVSAFNVMVQWAKIPGGMVGLAYTFLLRVGSSRASGRRR
jgi:hypothetical protein